MTHELAPALRPDFFGQLAATDPHQGRARRLFERGQVVGVNGNQANLLVGYDARNNPLELKQVPIISGYVPRMGDWVSIQYEAGHSGAPWVTGPSMAADEARDSAGIGVFSVSDAEPADPQRSMVYFDESHGTWRGWDGADWVDFAAKLHNGLPDLQGGGGGDYFHLAAGEHTALQDLQDGSGLASAWVKRLKFKAIDASATQRTQMFEVNGDFYWAVNATYNEGADQWNRVDTAQYAYLIGVHSEGNIPTEPIGGVVWWRATPGANPIGDWAAVGGWELGYMMTEHRNFVMGGMNLEMDGSGAPPYGRFTQSGSNDASGTVVTAMQRNSWYEGAGQWGRDSHDRNSAIVGFDANADLFVWWFPDSSEGNAPWGTAAWQERAKLNLGGSLRGRLDVTRSSSETAIGSSAFLAKHKTSGDMGDGFGAGYAFAIEDNALVEHIVGTLYVRREGADNTGRFSWGLASAGALAEHMSLTTRPRLALGTAAGDPVSTNAGYYAGAEGYVWNWFVGVGTSAYGIMSCAKARGTMASLAAVQSGDVIGRYDFAGHDGSAFRVSAQLRGYANQNWTGSALGTRVELWGIADGSTGFGKWASWANKDLTLYGAFIGEYQTQSGAWTDPTGPATNGRIVTVYSGTTGEHRLYVYSNAGWRYIGLT